jgi:hypothetical protein
MRKKQEKTNVIWAGDDLKLPALKTAFKSIVIFLQTEPIKTYRLMNKSQVRLTGLSLQMFWIEPDLHLTQCWIKPDFKVQMYWAFTWFGLTH